MSSSVYSLAFRTTALHVVGNARYVYSMAMKSRASNNKTKQIKHKRKAKRAAGIKGQAGGQKC